MPETEVLSMPLDLFEQIQAFDVSTMPEKLQVYWTEGEGAARIGWGTPGDFDRCTTNLRTEGVPGHMVKGACANLHKRALGVWPGQEATVTTDTYTEEPVDYPPTVLASLTAALAQSVFANPMLDKPTPLTVTDDGRVFGHVATWGTCHIGFDATCVTPPKSAAAYAYFLTGEVLTEDGPLPVGTITLGTGHAAATLGARPAAAHYDNTGLAAAYVNAGEDEWGIWVAGHLCSSVTAAQVEALRGSVLSGDWRRIGGNLEMVATLAVNVPGFPIPRLTAATTGRQPSALVASGVVLRPEVDPGPPTPEALIAAATRGALAAVHRGSRLSRLDQRVGLDKTSRLSRAHRLVEGD